jgi:hypothetical protein
MQPPKDPFAHLLGPAKRDPQLRLAKHDDGTEAVEGVPLDPRHYQAHEIDLKPSRLVIQCATGASHAPLYNLLMDVIHDRQFAASFVLVYNFMAITVIGRNLTPVIYAINHHRCGIITEYAAQAYDLPPADAPVITSITVEAAAVMSEQIERVGKGHR